MLRFILIACSLIPMISGQCGRCEVTPGMSERDKNQAIAYNNMPGHWVAASEEVNKKYGYLKNQDSFAVDRLRSGYGPYSCENECEVRWLFSKYTSCSYVADVISEYSASGIITGYGQQWWYKGSCTNKYRDNTNRLCKGVPKYSDKHGMWCYTDYAGSVYNWGHTHYPVCPSTNKMCVPWAKSHN